MTIDEAGNVYSTGDVTIKYDATGNQVWQSEIIENGHAHDLVLDDEGNVYVTGHSGED